MILKTNKLYNMDCREGLKHLDDECIDCCIASPPYWGLRDYGIEPSVWDGDVDCEHVFGDWNNIKNIKEYNSGISWDRPSRRESNNVSSNSKCVVCEKEFSGKIGQKFCSIKCLNTLSNDDRSNAKQKQQFCNKCGAWKGTLGLEPNFELYIKHLCDIYDQVKRVLKKTGTCWVNLGDSYGSSKDFSRADRQDLHGKETIRRKVRGFEKCLLMIPQRFAIEMVNRGWILRNVIIWHKPNCMPSSAKDRFTVDFEYVFFFVKSNKTQYWINEKTAQLVSKQPLGIKGIENSDWEWRECDKCLGTGIKHKKCKTCEGEGWIYNLLLQIERCSYCRGLGRIRQDKECKSCKGKGIKKYNFWKGRQYWFEQQRTPHQSEPHKLYAKKWNSINSISRNESDGSEFYNPLGRNMRTVWTIPTKPSPEAHFATFPTKLVEPMILAGCPKSFCKKCGKPREKIIERIVGDQRSNEPDQKRVQAGVLKGGGILTTSRPLTDIFAQALSTRMITKGYSDCGCNMGFKSGVVLDHFTGTGNTLLTAWKLGRDYIGFEISKEYCCEIANKKLSLTKNIRLDKWIMEYSPLKQSV